VHAPGTATGAEPIHPLHHEEHHSMDVKKTATDTAYIVVGVGVLGFQQAQVRRRDASAKVGAMRRDARGALREQAGRLKAATGGCGANLGGLGSTLGAKSSDLGTNVSNRVSNTVNTVGSTVKSTVTGTVSTVGSQVKAGTDAARSANPRAWVEPVVGDLRVRVEPVVEQLRTITLPGTVASLPDQMSKAIEVGRDRVQGRFGTGGTAPTNAATNRTA
jgi:hypothetical protein